MQPPVFTSSHQHSQYTNVRLARAASISTLHKQDISTIRIISLTAHVIAVFTKALRDKFIEACLQIHDVDSFAVRILIDSRR